MESDQLCSLRKLQGKKSRKKKNPKVQSYFCHPWHHLPTFLLLANETNSHLSGDSIKTDICKY